MRTGRIIVRANAKPGENLDNSDIELLFEVGDELYQLEPNTLDFKISPADRVTIQVSMDIHELSLNMPATVIYPDGSHRESRVTISGASPSQDAALNSVRDISKAEVEDESCYLTEVCFKAYGNDDSNACIVRAKPKGSL